MSMEVRIIRALDEGAEISYGIWDGSRCEFFNPAMLQDIHDDNLREMANEYFGNNPFPEADTASPYPYGQREAIEDLCCSSGSLIMSCTQEQAEYLAEMIQELVQAGNKNYNRAER